MTVQRTDSWERAEREKDIRQGIDLATTLEHIEKNFVITDPRLLDKLSHEACVQAVQNERLSLVVG